MTATTVDAPDLDPDAAVPPASARRRRGPVVVAAVALAGLAGIVAVAVAVSGPSDRPERAPAFDLPDLRQPDERIRLTDFRGRPLVVNFWASWCVPCRQEMPAFERVHQRLGDRVAFLGVDRLDQRAAALAFLAETGVTYPAAYDREATLDAPYRLVGMPTTLLISADGRLLQKLTGEVTEDELRAALRRHFPDVGA